MATVSSAITAAAAIIASVLYLAGKVARLVRVIDKIFALPGSYDELIKTMAVNNDDIRELSEAVTVLTALIRTRPVP